MQIPAPTNKRKLPQKKSEMYPLPPHPFVSCFVGRRGSGKTTLLIKLLLSRKAWLNKFDRIIIVSPTFTLQPIWSAVDKLGLTVYESFDEEVVYELIQNQKDMGPEKDHVLVILDDCLAEKNVKKNLISPLSVLAANGRHLGISMVMLMQKMSAISTVIRTNTDAFICFSAVSYREKTSLYEEVGNCEKKEFMKMYNNCTSERFSFYMCTSHGGRILHYKNWDQIKLSD